MTRRDFSLAAVLGSSLALNRCAPRQFFQKGVNFTAEWPDTYSSPGARELLRSLSRYGVDAVALVPYGFCRKGSPEVRFNGRKVWEKDSAIEALTGFAHEHDIKVFLRPQVWVPGGFPGDLEFSAEADRRLWFAGYELFLRHYATLARTIGADLFCVGVEFSRLVRYQEDWRKLIDLARQIYSGPLVYAANWGAEFENILFWDALDYIGLNNYYPLPDDLSAAGVVAKIERVQQRFERPVIFPEAGFASLQAPNREPWDETPRPISLDDQARCYEAVFQAFYRRPWFQGVYWWKVGSNGFGGPEDGSHTPWRKPAMDVIGRWYRGSRELQSDSTQDFTRRRKQTKAT